MDYFNNISYIISHIFLLLFLYLFITHRYSGFATRCICIASFLILTVTDIIKLNMFPDSAPCYVFMTILQIIVTQSTGILISKKRNTKVLFMDLSASNYVIIGSVVACILNIWTDRPILALIGCFSMHALLLFILYATIHDIWIRQYEKEYTKGWWKLCLIPVFFLLQLFFYRLFSAHLI
uniref:Uncharacterized protein n=1 Tax=Eubacterium plexicaudatum ASF492 TaxID=1235802 RepID=N2AIX3_9FIRM